MEILAVRGIVAEIVGLADKLLSLKGIKNGKLFLTYLLPELPLKNNLNPIFLFRTNLLLQCY